jgi:hypothetical protein
MPCEGGEAVMPTSEIRLNNIELSVSTAELKNLCHVENVEETPVINRDFVAFALFQTWFRGVNRAATSWSTSRPFWSVCSQVHCKC